ncbi:MAG: acetyl-CoA carboxylase, carboxyltransferase subunit beta [Elusimicrobiota bacterium]|nr:acetyl-CoA carboxylase, carboxyltransferase subunit beta [Endomicrobiia bacterium]MDW8165655.1 acetyl-CoA carboxylase, carboxyltransferase subunit beta [Elusimicrobiota bacterium]
MKNKSQIQVPKEIFENCPSCNRILLKKELQENFKICTKCGYIFRMSCYERIEMLADKGTFREFFKNYTSENILNFPEYTEKLEETKKKTNLNEACVCGICKIGGIKTFLSVLDFNFLGGSMGSVVGEKIALSFEKAKSLKIPVVIVSASGGARMQEGIISLMQMAKTSAACAEFKKTNLPYISVLTDPTTGGVSASFAMLGDIIIAETKALIGFAGPRVIEQTIKQKLPEGFQSAEFLLEHGFVDIVVQRKDLKNVIFNILKLCLNNIQNKKRKSKEKI